MNRVNNKPNMKTGYALSNQIASGSQRTFRGGSTSNNSDWQVVGDKGSRRTPRDRQLAPSSHPRGNTLATNGSQRKLRDTTNYAAAARSQPIKGKGGQRKTRDNFRKLYVLSNKNANKRRDNNPSHTTNYPINRGSSSQRKRDSFPGADTFSHFDKLVNAAVSFQYLPPREMASIWLRLSILLVEQRGQRNQQSGQLSREFETLYSRTLKGIPKYGPTQLCKTSLSMANIIKSVQNHRGGRGEKMSHRQLLHNIFLRDSSRKMNLFQTIAISALPLLVQFKPESYADLCCAIMVAEVSPAFHDGTTLIGHIADYLVALKDFNSFKTRQLCNIATSFAKAGISRPHLFEKLANQFVTNRDLGSLEPQDLSNILCAFANISHRKLFISVSDEMTAHRDIRSFHPRYVADILWAFANAKVIHSRLFRHVASELQDLGSFTPQGLSRMAWAFMTAKQSSTEIFERIAKGAILRKNGFVAQDVSQLLSAFACTGVRSPLLFQAMVSRVVEVLDYLDHSQLANIAWSYAVANENHPLLFSSAFIDIITEKFDGFSSGQMVQLYQWDLWQKEEMSKLGLPPEFQAQCYDAFASNKIHVSIYHKSLVCALKSIGLRPMEEVLTPKGFFLDTCVDVDGFKVGVRVEGPHNYISRAPTGKTILKRRQVEEVEGIRYLWIPHWEWKQLDCDDLKKDYLLQKLRDV